MRVIAIDGPSGSGKSTVARTLAARLGLSHLDTGAMYRAVASSALRRGIDPSDVEAVAAVVATIRIDLDEGGVVVDGVDATADIRGQAVTAVVSVVAANPAVRAELVRRQREWGSAHGGGVVEGRDIGTVVFPDAELKAYLTARLEVRAERRGAEIGEAATEVIAADLARRDGLDSGRAIDPLARAAGAVVIDTTDRSVEEIVEELLGLLASRSPS